VIIGALYFSGQQTTFFTQKRESILPPLFPPFPSLPAERGTQEARLYSFPFPPPPSFGKRVRVFILNIKHPVILGYNTRKYNRGGEA
jgi:hypothetical protein